jgi:hypothetical protein
VFWATMGTPKNSTLGVIHDTDAVTNAVPNKTEARRLQVDWNTKF